MPAASHRGASLAALVISGLAGLGAAGIAARHRSLGPDLARVQPGLRAPLLVLGRAGLTERLVASQGGTLVSRAPSAVLPQGLGRRRLAALPDREVPVWLYETGQRCDLHEPTGVLMWMHGGGLVGGSPAQDHALCSRIARELGCLVVSVDYRLAPRHPYPAALEDCLGVLHWLRDNARALDLDPDRLAVGGASAGGGLAAAVAGRARDEGVSTAFQLLFYPMLDDRTGAGGRAVPGRGDFVWTARANAESWEAYLGHPAGRSEERPWAVPARQEDLRGLPPAWIGVGDLDLFLDEDLAYARGLEAAGVPVQVRVEAGMYHGADVCTWSASMRDFRAEALEALGRALSG